MHALLQALNTAKETLNDYFEATKNNFISNSKNSPLDYLKWITTKTQLILNTNISDHPKRNLITRGDVVWVEFGFNVGEEFSGRHPAVVLKNGEKTLLVIPITSKNPTPKQINSNNYLEINNIYNFKPMKRWINNI